MKRILSGIWMIGMLLCTGLCLAACKNVEVHEEEAHLNVVRFYDVIPQGEEYWSESSKEMIALAYENTKAIEIEKKESAEEMLKKIGEIEYDKHFYRVGLFSSVDMGVYSDIPYVNQMDEVEELTGIGIEYVIMGSWEELERELEKVQDDGITKVVLYNNSYPKSLLKELQSGRYADLQSEMEAQGLYDEQTYDQTVIGAARIDGMQFAVPLLYNVNGVIQGEQSEYNVVKDTVTLAYQPNLPGGEGISFEEFLEKLIVEMEYEESKKSIPFISAAILEEIEPELFISAAGGEWENYEEQQALFELLYQYVKVYQNTQFEEGASQQYLWGQCLEELKYTDAGLGFLSDNWVSLLKMEEYFVDMGDRAGVWASQVPRKLLEEAKYMVESSKAEVIAYHSVTGMLTAYNFYESQARGDMVYFPIGTLGEAEEYAAQPINYAAMLEGGDSERAVKVIEALLSLDVDSDYGFSVNNEVRAKQIEDWSARADQYWTIGVRSIDSADNHYRGSASGAYWTSIIQGTEIDGKQKYAVQLQDQLDHVAVAQIPDREVLSIWQDTLTEAVDSGLSAEAGFELLCQRMDEWYE